MCCQIAESRQTPIDLFGMQTTVQATERRSYFFGSCVNRQVQTAFDSCLRLVKCTWSLESLHEVRMSAARLLCMELLGLLDT